MTKIRSRAWRNEYNISMNDGEERVSEAVRVIYSMGAMSALASVVKREELREIFHNRYTSRDHVPIGLDEPDYLCFVAYMVFTLAEVYKRHRDTTTVNFIVSKKEKVTHRLKQEFYPEIRRYMKTAFPELAPLLGDFAPGSMEDYLPLQMADVLCWHLQRYYAQAFDRIDESRIWMLTKERDGYKHEWERDDLETMAAEFGLA